MEVLAPPVGNFRFFQKKKIVVTWYLIQFLPLINLRYGFVVGSFNNNSTISKYVWLKRNPSLTYEREGL